MPQADSIQPWELRTPVGDGQVLLWPAGQRWPELVERSAERFARLGPGLAGVRLLDVPVSLARQRARDELPVLVGQPGGTERPWIVTGHQTYPYHPGIWAKHVAVHWLARRTGGAGVSLNVDHDLPRSGRQLIWPAADATGQLVRRGDLQLDTRRLYEQQPAPDPARLEDIHKRVGEDLARLLADPAAAGAGSLLAGLAAPNHARGRDTSFGRWFARFRADLDDRLGLHLVESLTSELAQTDSFLLFAGDIMGRAEQFLPAYNTALDQTRRATGHNPAADLRVDDGHMELPFWSVRRDVPGRWRVFIAAGCGQVTLSDQAGPIGQLPSSALRACQRAVPALREVLAEAGASLRPRALTLTLFARLLLADLFVHGVGGASYDLATDRLLAGFYGMPPPDFAVASATLLLPLNIEAAGADELVQARRRLRDMRFNPQRYLPAGRIGDGPAGELLAVKEAAIRRNLAIRDGRIELPAGDRRQERARLFARIRRCNSGLAAMLGEMPANCQARVEQLTRQGRAAEIALARDYFYGLFPRTKLTALAETIKQSLAQSGAR